MKLRIAVDEHHSVVLFKSNGEKFFMGDNIGRYLYLLPTQKSKKKAKKKKS